MLRKIPIITAIILCTLIVTQYALGADDPASQLKQADELTKNRQYDQAEQIYLAIVQQDIPEAFSAQKSLTILYITTNKLPEADAAFQQLLARFSEHKGIAEALWKIGIAYNQAAKSDKAIEVHQYNVEHFPDDVNAVFSQVEIVKFHLGKGDEAAADASVSNFLTVFSGQPTLPKVIYHVARRYDEFKKPNKAVELHQYNVEHFPEDTYALWSQAEIIFSYIRDGKDAQADEAFDKLLTVFANQPTLSHEIYQVARRYNKVGKPEKALSLHQYNVECFPKDIHAMWSQVEVIYAHISDANAVAANTAFDKLVSTFSNQPTLSKEVYEVAKRFSKAGSSEKSRQVYQYLIERWTAADDIDSRRFVLMSHIALNDDEAAEALFDEVLKDYANNKLLHNAINVMAEAYWESGCFMEAQQEIKVPFSTLDGPPDNARYYIAKALDKWQLLIGQEPNATNPSALYYSGQCYERLRQFDKALECYLKLAQYHPNFKFTWDALFTVGLICDELSQSKVISEGEARSIKQSAYEQLVRDYPDMPVSAHALRWLQFYAK